MSDVADADVIVVGYGPVGATLAVLLAGRGRRVTVLERWPEAYPLPRAVHFDHEVGRILQSCGVGPQLRELSEPADIYEWRHARPAPRCCGSGRPETDRRAGRRRRCSISPRSRQPSTEGRRR